MKKTKKLDRHLRALGVTSKARLVRESAWMRVYRAGPKVFIHDSKFLTDGLEVKAREFRKLWRNLGRQEKLEFCAAYRAKPKLTREDELILDFLMKQGDTSIWRAIISILPRHPRRKRVLTFIRRQVRKQPPPVASFFMALEVLRDVTSVPFLRRRHRQYVTSDRLTPRSSDWKSCIDYLHCCRALWRLTGHAEFKRAIADFGQSNNPVVRRFATELLKSHPVGSGP